ncbi:MAG: 1-deoxy-D-xylulose-5-phosphate reductoisomerase [Propionibacteriaceae bacterium]|nr:1-deoxy-D-xylulose-5-phosphate reductoisomerase [Propionibacteriaceae bacterium]
MRDVIILGSTGSIGTQALDVVARHRDRFRVVGLSAGGGRLDLLADQIRTESPATVALPTEQAAHALTSILDQRGVPIPALIVGPHASADVAQTGADVVLNAITGYAGLEPTLATLRAGSTLALANKESLVVGGALVTDAAAPGQIVPVDSEHSAFAQALRSGQHGEVSRLILTASGGPFRGRTRERLRDVTVDQAMAHPTWDMGRVVTINSSTMVNKGLELIEAVLLFDVGWDQIEVVVHPQSVVHSMVEFQDGSTIAQCSPPDMRLPIALGLSWPDRLDDVARPCAWASPTTWTFEPVDAHTFPAVELARTVGRAGGTAPAVFNAANEVCVDAFCAHDLSFLGIVDTVAAVVAAHRTAAQAWENGTSSTAPTLDQIRAADSWARQAAREAIGRNS